MLWTQSKNHNIYLVSELQTTVLHTTRMMASNKNNPYNILIFWGFRLGHSVQSSRIFSFFRYQNVYKSLTQPLLKKKVYLWIADKIYIYTYLELYNPTIFFCCLNKECQNFAICGKMHCTLNAHEGSSK